MDLKYTGIVLCFFYLICLLPADVEKLDAIVVRTALFFTLLADTFLIKVGDWEAGVGCFIMVQMCYFYRLNKTRVKSIILNCAIFFAVYMISDLLFEEVSMLVILVQFYFVSLLRNVWDSVLYSHNRFFQLGLILFLLCDLSVGLFNLPEYVSVSLFYEKYIATIAATLIWIFYLPSQVLLCLSVKKS